MLFIEELYSLKPKKAHQKLYDLIQGKTKTLADSVDTNDKFLNSFYCDKSEQSIFRKTSRNCNVKFNQLRRKLAFKRNNKSKNAIVKSSLNNLVETDDQFQKNIKLVSYSYSCAKGRLLNSQKYPKITSKKALKLIQDSTQKTIINQQKLITNIVCSNSRLSQSKSCNTSTKRLIPSNIRIKLTKKVIESNDTVFVSQRKYIQEPKSSEFKVSNIKRLSRLSNIKSRRFSQNDFNSQNIQPWSSGIVEHEQFTM